MATALNGRNEKRAAKEGFGMGVVAGVIFALAEVVAAVMMQSPPVMPIRMFASIVLGQDAFGVTPLGTTVFAGIVVHLVLSGVFGMIYALVNTRSSARAQTRRGTQLAMGFAFGVALWLVNIQIIARIAYPWFLDTPQFLQLSLHGIFYGMPLGALYATERRGYRIGPTATQP